MCVHVTGNMRKTLSLWMSTKAETLTVWMGMMPPSSPLLKLYKSKYKYKKINHIMVLLLCFNRSLWFFVFDCSEEEAEEFRVLKENLRGGFESLFFNQWLLLVSLQKLRTVSKVSKRFLTSIVHFNGNLLNRLGYLVGNVDLMAWGWHYGKPHGPSKMDRVHSLEALMCAVNFREICPLILMYLV